MTMIKISFYQSGDGHFKGFDFSGHAGYAEENDIVCSAVSALVINCVNSLESLTDAVFVCESDEEMASVSLFLTSFEDERAQLLLSSLALGIQSIEDSYKEYIDLIFKEV